MTENIQGSGFLRRMSARWDLIAFISTFASGLVLYLVLHFGFHISKWFIILIIVVIMLLYGLVVLSLPRLRVRLDQAGDNAYYLGLLFTLVSMAIALYEFGRKTGAEADITGTESIISNFGIALASTITGILLRVVLHQMRIDPAEVEAETRIELSEASKKVQSSINLVTNDLGRFHEELQQKFYDSFKTLVERTESSVLALTAEVTHATTEMIKSTGYVHSSALQTTEEATKLVKRLAIEAAGAIERLRSVEQPPLVLVRRFERVAKTLDTTGDQTERIASSLQGTADSAKTATDGISLAFSDLTARIASSLKGTADSAKTATDGISQAVTDLRGLAARIVAAQTDAEKRVSATVETIISALGSLSTRLENNRALLDKIEQENTQFARESARTGSDVLEVVKQLTEISRGVSTALNNALAKDTDGKIP